MSTLPPMNIRYPYDPTGKSKSNYVAGEVHTLPPQLQRIIVPALGAYYADSLVVRYNDRELIRGVDYELAALYHDATVATGKDVNVMIYFSNQDIVGDVVLYYQVVGGQFTGVWESIQQYVNALLVDPRQVRWDDILNKPHFFVPKEHFHDINDVYGLNFLIPKLEEIRQAILRIRSKEMRRLYDHFLKVKRDTEAITSQIGNLVAEEVRKLHSNNDQVELLKQQIATLRNRITALESNTAISQEIAKLKQKDTALTGTLDTLSSNLNGLTSTVTNYGNEINAIKAKNAEQDNTVNNFMNNVLNYIPLDPKSTNIIKKTSLGLLAESNGLTYDTITALPEKTWTKGTSVLSKGADGTWYRMVPPESLFQDIGVAISSLRTVQNLGSTFKVKYTVTNSGVAKNEKTTLTVILPQQNERSAYTVDNYKETLQRGDRVVKTSDNTWDIYGLVNGGTFILEFDIVPTIFGTYQLGGQVTVNRDVDTESSNNNASLILTANTVIDSNYVPSVNCPMITCVDIDTNRQLTAVKTKINPNGSIGIDSSYWRVSMNGFKVKSLSGKRFKLTNASSILPKLITGSTDRQMVFYNGSYRNNADVVYMADTRTSTVIGKYVDLDNNPDVAVVSPFALYWNGYPAANGRYFITTSETYKPYLLSLTSLDANATISNSDLFSSVGVSFDSKTGILTIDEIPNRDVISLVIACRPLGSNCVWQVFVITTEEDIYTTTSRLDITGIPSRYISEQDNIVSSYMTTTDPGLTNIGINRGEKNNLVYRINTISYTINLPKRTAFDFTITGAISNYAIPPMIGNITITKESHTVIRVTTTNLTSETDNVTFGPVTINFV